MHLYRQVIKLFTPDELNKLLPLLDIGVGEKGWGDATVSKNNSIVVASDFRDTEMATLPFETAAGVILADRINEGVVTYGYNLKNAYGDHALVGPSVTASNTKTSLQPLQLLRYNEGQHYSWHVDHGTNYFAKKRSLSVVLYLSDDFDGGHTEFPDRSFKPRAGEALYFPSTWNFPHRAQKIDRGQKLVCVTWVEVDHNAIMK